MIERLPLLNQLTIHDAIFLVGPGADEPEDIRRLFPQVKNLRLSRVSTPRACAFPASPVSAFPNLSRLSLHFANGGSLFDELADIARHTPMRISALELSGLRADQLELAYAIMGTNAESIFTASITIDPLLVLDEPATPTDRRPGPFSVAKLYRLYELNITIAIGMCRTEEGARAIWDCMAHVLQRASTTTGKIHVIIASDYPGAVRQNALIASLPVRRLKPILERLICLSKLVIHLRTWENSLFPQPEWENIEARGEQGGCWRVASLKQLGPVTRAWARSTQLRPELGVVLI